MLTAAFMKHQQSKAHNEAVKVIVTLPKSTKDIGEQLFHLIIQPNLMPSFHHSYKIKST